MHKSPFKFLDSYTKDDRDIFFGRDNETEDLYRKIFESKMLLVYGVSGTGKTSLINCGLANKFSDSDWLPVNIRRGANINESLTRKVTSLKTELLKNGSNSDSTDPQGHLTKGNAIRKGSDSEYGDLAGQLHDLYLDHFKPIYLIFDQLEELFIFGSKPERDEFVQAIKAIVESEVNCRFIFVIREEYLAGVTEFEAEIPAILQNRIRIEKMSRSNAKQAIEGPCKVASIAVEEGFADALLDKLSPGSADVELTYLQVFLDKIYRIADPQGHLAKSTAINKGSSSDYDDLAGQPSSGAEYGDPSTPLRTSLAGQSSFTLSLLAQLGEVRDLLGAFLEEQVSQLDDPDTGLTMLKAFVSTKGTKRQVTEEDINDFAKTIGRNLDPQGHLTKGNAIRKGSDSEYGDLAGRGSILNEYLQKFVAIRLLRDKDENGRYELRHDALAAKIYEKITLVEKELMEVRQFVENAYETYLKRRVFLSRADLNYFAPYRDKIILKQEISEFVERSGKEIQKKLRRKLAIAIVSVCVLLAIFAGFTVWAMRERSIAETEKQKSKALYYNLLSKEIVNTNPVKALGIAEYAFSLDTSNSDIYDNILRIYYDHNINKPIHINGFFSSISTDERFFLVVNSTESSMMFGENFIEIYSIQGEFLKKIVYNAPIRSANFSKDNKLIISTSYDGTAQIWNESGELIKKLEGHRSVVTSCDISQNNDLILTGSRDSTARLWSIDGKLLRILKGHSNTIQIVHFSPDGEQILTGSDDSSVRLWSLEGNLLKILEGHKGRITTACYSNDGRYILTTSSEKACLWNIEGKKLNDYIGTGNITAGCFSADGSSIFLGFNDGRIVQQDYYGNNLNMFDKQEYEICHIYHFLNKDRMLSVSNEKIIRIWNFDGCCLRLISKPNDSILSTAISPDGKNILLGFSNHIACTYDLEGNVKSRLIGHAAGVNKSEYSKNGKYIVTASSDLNIKLWNSEGAELQSYNGHKSGITSLCFSPDCHQLLSASLDSTCRLWDMNGNLVKIFKHPISLYYANFSPDGRNIVTYSQDVIGRLWDLNGNLLKFFTGKNIRVAKGVYVQTGIDFITYSNNGQYIIINTGGQLKLLDNSGSEILKFRENASHHIACFSPDDKYILIGTAKRSASLWNLEGNKILTLSKFDKDFVQDICFSSDGKYFITQTKKTISLWDLEGHLLQIIKMQESWNNLVRFSPDGKDLIVREGYNSIKIYDIKT
ncbi:MAG: hypothetical protein HY738_06170, partial [Bacteroidia bacterium]|nr:hypothetical protein [Bacteroidia bacterium]